MRDFDPRIIGYLMIFFFLGIGLIVVDFVLAELARKAWGQFALWFLAFLFLPVISHALFAFLYINYSGSVRKFQMQKKAERIQERYRGFPKVELFKSPVKFSVTPFDSPAEDQPVRPSTESIFLIADYRRDPEVEKLIEWGQFSVALEIIEKQLDLHKNDPKVVEVYETYHQFIKRKIGLY